MNLLMDDLSGTEPGGKVDPADSVTLFVTLDGGELAAPGSDFSTTMRLTPDGLKLPYGLLSEFVTQLGGEVMVCPLCWSAGGYRGVHRPTASWPTPSTSMASSCTRTRS